MIKPNPKNQTKRNGRPYKVIDYKMLDNLCALQCTGAEIAGAMGMDYDTLNNGLKRETGKGFTDYFSEKRSVGLISLRRQQYKVAMQGNPSLLKWLGQNWLGQSDTPQQVQADVKLTGFRIVDDNIDLTE